MIEDIPVVHKTKILGIWIGTQNSEANVYDWNFKDQLEKISSICDSWAHRTLSLKGKITVANALLVSLLQYPSSVTFTPSRVIRDYKRIISAFLWDAKKPKIAYDSLIQTIDRGGIKLIDLELRIKVNLLQWFRRVIRIPERSVGITLSYLADTNNIKRYLSYRNPPFDHNMEKYHFYSAMMKRWKEARAFEPTTEEEIRRESLWFNQSLSSGLYTQQRHKWQGENINTIGDVCHDSEDRLLSHTEINEKFNIPCTFLEALSLRAAIPLKWRKMLTANFQSGQESTGITLRLDQDNSEDIDILSAKRMYSKLLASSTHVNTALKRWQEGDDDLQISGAVEWTAACYRAFNATRETKVQSFQYKVLNRVIPCGVFLKRLRIRETDECSLCQVKDSIAHFLFNCRTIRAFWQGICTWFNNADDLYLNQISAKEFIFGIPKENHRSAVINTVLAYVRYYIHRQRLFHEGRLDLLQWLREFREKLKIEQWICARSGKTKHFTKWKNILREMG